MIRQNGAYIPAKATKRLVYLTGLLIVLLCSLILTYHVESGEVPSVFATLSLYSILHIGLAVFLAYKNRYELAGVLTALYYFVSAVIILLNRGAGHASGLLLLGFVIFLTGVVTKAKHTTLATILCIFTLFSIHTIHTLGLLGINPTDFKLTPEELLYYACLLGIFGVISQSVATYIRKGFEEADEANLKLAKQKEWLARKLEQEKFKLKNAHMEETKQFYRFAEIGQSTVATLHELSNQLGVLNYDIEDLTENRAREQAIKNTKESLRQINSLISETRKHLSSKQSPQKFNPLTTLSRAVKDAKGSRWSAGCKIIFTNHTSSTDIRLTGNPIDLSNVVSILIRNACEACSKLDEPRVAVIVRSIGEVLAISIKDNGPGVSSYIKDSIFNPVKSEKSDGLGIGLYVAKHIVCSEFKGSLHLENSPETTFVIEIPVARQT